ncbi:MAG TPA: DUF1674 domain-containing protein [Aestuariivirga sp.]|jgi:hypothetical protein|nr:DUF1674 domain-containing protein [Aestuariivirga sp.]
MVLPRSFDKMEKRDLPPSAVRALAEAEERRAAVLKVERPKEINGRKGPEPTRYGDWESKGIATDF